MPTSSKHSWRDIFQTVLSLFRLQRVCQVQAVHKRNDGRKHYASVDGYRQVAFLTEGRRLSTVWRRLYFEWNFKSSKSCKVFTSDEKGRLRKEFHLIPNLKLVRAHIIDQPNPKIQIRIQDKIWSNPIRLETNLVFISHYHRLVAYDD